MALAPTQVTNYALYTPTEKKSPTPEFPRIRRLKEAPENGLEYLFHDCLPHFYGIVYPSLFDQMSALVQVRRVRNSEEWGGGREGLSGSSGDVMRLSVIGNLLTCRRLTES